MRTIFNKRALVCSTSLAVAICFSNSLSLLSVSFSLATFFVAVDLVVILVGVPLGCETKKSFSSQ